MTHSFSKPLLLVFLMIVQAACTPLATQQPQLVEPATPTPEIFNPLDPSPTPSENTLPLTCQVTDLSVYVNEEWGYCFAYPTNFTIDEESARVGFIRLLGPALEDTADPIHVSLEITTYPVPEESALAPLVDAYLTSFQNVAMPMPITREPSRLGREPAETTEPIPGLLSSRVVMALHNNILFMLRFHPSDIEIAKPDLEALSQTVTGSFDFLPLNDLPAAPLKTIHWSEFGQDISLSYDPILAPWVEARTVPEVPPDDQIMFAESHPAYAQIRFLGFQGGRSYELPLLPVENHIAQVMVFQTADFSGYGDDAPLGFVNQLQALKNLLETSVDSARCAQPVAGESVLPFLPWVNSAQSLCAQPQIIEFSNGKGIRYLTYYAQDPSPVLDQRVFYTFQGLTDDEQFYISAVFPVGTGIFPTQPPACDKCGEPNYDPFTEWKSVVSEQLAQLNALQENDFEPSLGLLDELIRSIQISQ